MTWGDWLLLAFVMFNLWLVDDCIRRLWRERQAKKAQQDPLAIWPREE